MNSWKVWAGNAAKVVVVAGSLASLVAPVRAQAPSPGPRALGPVVRITSPLGDASVTPGEGKPGAGSINGSGFLITIEATTRDSVNVTAKEALNIRDTSRLGQPNLLFPGLFVSFDVDLTKPDGGIIPKNTNLASLFNILGVDDTPGPGITVWTAWHVLESIPADVSSFNITASIRDNVGRVAIDRINLRVARGAVPSGQALTPAPSGTPLPGDDIDDADGPEVAMVAPRVPTRVAQGPAGTPAGASGALFFLQVSALDRSRNGIAVKEGVIDDKPQIPNPKTNNGVAGPNRNFPGLNVTFDVPLRQPNGNLVAAGVNLAPLFNVAGSEIDKDGFVMTVADWVVGGSLELPVGKRSVTINARVTDNAGRSSSVRHVVGISDTRDGQDLTPTPDVPTPVAASSFPEEN